MRQSFNPCEDCPLKGKDANASLLLAGKAMGEIYTSEDDDRMYGSLTKADRAAAEAMEYGQYPSIDGESCEGPKKAFLTGKLGCRGYIS